MIIHGGEPPHIEVPEPRLGEVLSRLNQVTYQVEQRTTNFNADMKAKLASFTAGLTTLVVEVLQPIDAHIAARGVQHGETKATVDLSNKDNYRMATLAEMLALSPVSAYVSPNGAKASVLANSETYNPTAFQNNDAFQMASYFMPDEYPVGVPTAVQATRYLGFSLYNPMLVNGDRLILSPQVDTAKYQKQSIFVSGATEATGGSQFSEVQNLNVRYLGNNWNALGGTTSASRVALFKPLADKKIYEFKNQLALGGANVNLQLYRGYGSTIYKGLATSVALSGQTITINHKFFKVDLVDTDPTLVELVDSNYGALFTQINKDPVAAPANGSHTYQLTDFMTLAPGQTVVGLGNNAQSIVTSLYWNAQDSELYLFVVVPITLRMGGAVRYMNITFIEAIAPGTLRSGGSAAFTQLGTLEKDTINADMTITEGAKWLSVSDKEDFFNPALFPGAVLADGEVVKSSCTKYGIRVKRAKSALLGINAWAAGPREVMPIKEVRTEVYAPSRHAPFRAIPERLFPSLQDGVSTQYLTYALNRESGRYEWVEQNWNTSSPVGVEANGRFGIRSPDTERVVDLYMMPRALSTYVNKSGIGTSTRALAFTNDNNYKGYASIGYSNGVLTLGAEVQLSPANLITLRGAAGKMRVNAAAANPAIDDALRETQIHVYAVGPTRAVIIMSDGISYAEAAIADYAVNGGICTLTFAPTIGLVLKPVTPGGQTVTGANRNSLSGDDVWMDGSDLLAVQVTPDNWQIAITRPFGNIYGDLSFSVSGFNNAQPTFTPRTVNPARLYAGTHMFDLVDELHPPLLVPGKGVYQYDPTNDRYATAMVEVGGTAIVDPYEINEAGWVVIPAGSKTLIRGRAYVLTREYPVKVDPTGTTYCYLTRQGDTLVAIGSPVVRETLNSEVLFGVAVNGVLQINHSYLVLDNHVVSPTRRGSAIPVFDDNGGQGVNKFVTQRDVS